MNIIPTEQEINTLSKIGQMAIKTGFLPSSIKTPEQAIVIALKGKELGIPPFQAFSQIAVVQGKPTISAELMLALIYKNVQSAEINFEVNSNEKCVINARRKETHKYSKFEFNIKDATQAGLMGKDNWNKYTAAMLRARCITAMARALFADSICGVSYTAEELGADVNEEGEVISQVSASEVSSSQKLSNDSPKIAEAELIKIPASVMNKITFGKYKGLTLDEAVKTHGADQIKDYAEYILIKADMDKKPIKGQVKDFIDSVKVKLGDINVPLNSNDDSFDDYNSTVVNP